MPFILTTVHDPKALAATCRRFGSAPPVEGCVHLADLEVSGWVIRLAGLRQPLVCDTLTGRVAYHPADNAFGRYARIMRFLQRYYDVQAQQRQGRFVSRTLASLSR